MGALGRVDSQGFDSLCTPSHTSLRCMVARGVGRSMTCSVSVVKSIGTHTEVLSYDLPELSSLGLRNMPTPGFRWGKRSANRPANRETGLEMPCCPASDLLWVQITQSYPNRLRFSSLPCPQSPCHSVFNPVFKEGFF